jgi:hypothetical protein
MSATNGHAPAITVADEANQASAPQIKGRRRSASRRSPTAAPGSPASHESIAKLLDELQVPFDSSLVRWRAHETRMDDRRLLGLVLPYADPRAYTDRLNLLVTPVGWTNKYEVTTTPTKIVVTCQLSIHELGTHSGTGEEWARNEHAATSAEAQAFKRACSNFGLGRYLYSFEGKWLDLDRERRPRTIPALPDWATPDGWRRGLRPIAAIGSVQTLHNPRANGTNGDAPTPLSTSNGKNVVREIMRMERELGKALYHGLLTRIAKVWSPSRIRAISMQRTVLEHMQAAQRGIQRAAVAQEKLSRPSVIEILRSLEIDSLDKIHDLESLQRVVVAFEKAAELGQT